MKLSSRLAVLLGSVVWIAATACTQTVVDRSARKRDPASDWANHMERATRFHRSGLLAQAERQYGLALESARAFAPTDRRTIETLSQRAELYLSQRLYPVVEADYLEIIERERAAARGPSGGLANALNNLALFYMDLARADEALVLLYEAVEIRTVLFGSQHPHVALLVQNLGECQRRLEQYENAEELLLAALAIYAASGPEYYGDAAIAQNSLALTYRMQGRAAEAERTHLDAIRLSIKAHGESNSDVGVFSRDLANLYAEQRRFNEAAELYEASIAIFRGALGSDSYQESKTYRAYADMLEAAGHPRRAADYRARADATGF